MQFVCQAWRKTAPESFRESFFAISLWMKTSVKFSGEAVFFYLPILLMPGLIKRNLQFRSSLNFGA